MSPKPPRLRFDGRRLAAHRGDRSQADIARQADVTDAYINLIESGQRIPSLHVFLRIAEAVGCDPCDLLVDDQPDNEPVVAA